MRMQNILQEDMNEMNENATTRQLEYNLETCEGFYLVDKLEIQWVFFQL